MLYVNNTAKLLGLEDVTVKKVWEEADWRHIAIELPRRIHRCPICGAMTNTIHDYREQRIRDISSFGKHTMLHLRKRRYRCESCGKRFAEENLFVPRYHQTTSRLVTKVIDDFRGLRSAKQIASENGISITTAFRYFGLVSYHCGLLPEVLSICFLIFAIVCCLCLVIVQNIHLTYDKEKIEVKRLFRRKKVFCYTDIIGVLSGVGGGFTLKCKNGNVLIDAMATGGDDFFDFTQRQYCRRTGNDFIPEIQSRLFNGYVLEPVSMVVMVSIVGVLLAGLAVAVSIEAAMDFDIPSTLINETITFTDATVSDGEMQLKTGEQTYSIYVRRSNDISKIESAIKGKQQFTCSVVASGAYPQIWELKVGPTTIISMADSLRYNQRRWINVLLGFWGATLLYWALAIAEYRILCSAPKHPILGKLLVKEENRNF